jgi:predicted DNA-binding transcriptional regulator YafY
MPLNKNAIIRYHTLDNCFRNPGRKYFIEDLIEECNNALFELEPNSTGVSRRTVLYDIRFMESEQGWSIPLERFKDVRKIYFRYSDLNFSIKNQLINETEINQIVSGLQVLSKFKGLPQFEWIEEIVTRIEHAFSLKGKSETIIDFDSNIYLKGINFLGELFNSILYKKVLLITYHSFKSLFPIEIEFHPYFLKQYNNRWFVFGSNPDFDNITNLALDRIIKIAEIQKEYIENSCCDFNEYFEDVIGVTVNPEDELVKTTLWVRNDLVPYIKTKPIHGSQKYIGEDEKGMTISIEIIPNYEFEQVILNHGERIKVLDPPELREKVVNRLKEAYENYI